ncbi:DeoR/GlpR family DNA-binding transcription regulator [Enterococcus cecorum]|uniref:DeoR/GlpR family DNA-binding transcription regulator n=1 Tax=Enterococcus cecorum TaxID=44008 RepID=UPI00209C2A24|nr:DeoR/GlpR family DNA-binding transcription regulator [Enterococcus cecorum]
MSKIKINLPKKMKRSNEEIRQRREEILHYLKENGRTEINDLSKYFNVSEMTIRRDCAKLSEMGQIIQPFGYVEIFQEVEGQINDSLEQIKLSIAKEAARHVEDGDTLFINTSSTVTASLQFLQDTSIILMTNNLAVADIQHHPDSSIILSGGEIRYSKKALTGDIAVDSFAHARSDVSIICCDGVDLTTGITTSVFHESKINQKIIENSSTLIVF